MATEDESNTDEDRKELENPSGAVEERTDAVSFDGSAPAQLGITRYVHAAFLAGGVLVAYLAGKLLAMIWNILADWPAAVRAVPQLVIYAEDERPTFTMLVGAAVGILAIVITTRKAHVRRWADEVATELYKVHWPEREIVTNGTIVVLVAGLFATVYIGLLDRVWAFLTNLVYGA
jgi:preprotein translocase subunit SecE